MSFPNAGTCRCGWVRPVVATCAETGNDLPPPVVVKTLCPTCGNIHTHRSIEPKTAESEALQAHVEARFG